MTDAEIDRIADEIKGNEPFHRAFARAILAAAPVAAPAQEPAGWRDFIVQLSHAEGGMLNGNRISMAARKLLNAAPAQGYHWPICVAIGCSEPTTDDSMFCVAHRDDAPVVQQEHEEIRLAGISAAAMGYWKEGDTIFPQYDHPALRDVAKLYAKYEALLAAAPVAAPAQQEPSDIDKLRNHITQRLAELPDSWLTAREELERVLRQLNNA